MRLTEHFVSEELICPCCGWLGYSQEAIEILEAVRVAFGFPMILNSGQRCPAYDAEVHRRRYPDFTLMERHGPHTVTERRNIAIDVKCYGELAHKLDGVAHTYGFTGIGVAQRGPHVDRFLHLDRLWTTADRPRPTVWSY
jgi:hypothetical protein